MPDSSSSQMQVKTNEIPSSTSTQHIDGKNRESEDDFQVYHIPTILNGKIENKNIEKVSTKWVIKTGKIKNRNSINTK